MILAVTPNPSLDRALVLADYQEGGVLRATHVMQTAGGKGINMSYAARSIGVEMVNLGFQGGHTGEQIMKWMAEEGFKARWTVVGGGWETRCTTHVVNRASRLVTVINENGMPIDSDAWDRFVADIHTEAGTASIVAMCGSCPPGAPMDGYQKLLRDLMAAGKAVWVDAAGKQLAAAIETPGAYIKVNGDEIGGILGMSVKTVREAAEAARRFAGGRGVACVVTLGGDGAVYADGARAWHAHPPAIQMVSPVGSGDSFLAGLLIGIHAGDAPPEALRRAVAAGTANALSIPAGRFTHEEYAAMLAGTRVEELA
jgi:1-phosphofructokinase family hexose kinase